MQQRLSLSSSMKMGSSARSIKSKRVSWAPQMSLCQVRLFLSEDAPSQSGSGAQDLLQAKASWLWHSTSTDPEEQLPPGFEGPQSSWKFEKDTPQLALIKWQCPHRFVLNTNWQVVAGGESEETGVQNQRELRVLEAIYPRPSSIPPSPSSPELQDDRQSDLYTPLIPITPIEEDNDMADPLDPVDPIASLSKTWQKPGLPIRLPDYGTACYFPALGSQPEQSKGPAPSVTTAPMNENQVAAILPGVEQDVAEAAASVVLTAIMTSNKEGNLIDRDLLINILKNPKLMEELAREQGTTTGPHTNLSKSETLSVPMAMPSGQLVFPAAVHASRPEPDMLTAPTEPLYPKLNAVVPTLNPRPESLTMAKPSTFQAGLPPPVKDISYYKSLIRQHGEEKHEVRDQTIVGYRDDHHGPKLGIANSEISQSSRHTDLRSRVQKPCVYFNSPRGCRNGANCIYQHDGTGHQEVANVEEVQNSKRIKLEREITGRS